tara:strand:- start:39 stop:620 length:582 start_codon:yes stop_codon:yes gene_type:complete
MPVSINGNTGVITGLAVGGLPDGTVDADSLASSAVTAGKLASGVGGKVLQVVSQNLTTQMSTSSTSYVDTGLTASITPSATTSKILVTLCIATAISGDHNGYLRLLRDSTEINSGSGGDTNSMFGINGNSTAFRYSPVMYNSNFLDTPSTTSATTYKVQVRAHSGSYTMYINRRNIDTNFGVASNITLMEVAA